VNRHFDHFLMAFIEWIFRRRSPALLMMRLGVTCLALTFGAGWILGVSIPFRDGNLDLRFDCAGGTPQIVVYSAATLGVLLIALGAIWEIIRYRDEQRRLARKKVIVVEARGLRDTTGTPLHEAVPEKLEGHRDQVLIDLRQRVKDGVIVEPRAALEKLTSLAADLERRENGLDRRDITYVYGGLAPVPLTFLTGVLMDDEGPVVVMDWDRHAENWRALDGDDDGQRFKVANLDVVPRGVTDVALAVSVSYGVDVDGVRHKVGGIPVVEMALASGSPDCHWSESKQKALGQQFLDTAIALGNQGVKRVHLFLAAQNSVVFRFGRLYDKRNLPEVTVYQYQREDIPPYPWGIRMPVSGVVKPEVV
jgi:hypothetical protein